MKQTGAAHKPAVDSQPDGSTGVWRAARLRVVGIIALILVAGGLVVAAAAYFTIGLPGYNTRDYLTIRELQSRAAEMTGRAVRVTGAVLGQSIQYKPARRQLTFEMANIPTDSSAAYMKVTYTGAMPRLMKDESQVILTGKLSYDGTFIATALAVVKAAP